MYPRDYVQLHALPGLLPGRVNLKEAPVKFSTFATDLTLESDGVKVFWKGKEGDPDASWVKIARMGNAKFTEMYQKMLAPHKFAQERGTLDEKLHEDIILQVIAHTVIKDWGGWEDDEGNSIKYNPQNALAMLRGLKDFKNEVVAVASRSDLYRNSVREADAGNS